MRCGINKPRELKVRCYTARVIDINDYLDVFPGAKVCDKIGDTEINEIILNGMPNGWSKKSYVHIFYCKTITFKNMLIGLNALKL